MAFKDYQALKEWLCFKATKMKIFAGIILDKMMAFFF